MSSRQRLYLNLKQSITKLFKTPAHYLKEIAGKHSLFEKPYFEAGYREMQLRLSNPTWTVPKFGPGSGPGPGFGPGIWPPARKHTFIFDDGICSFSGQSGACGETVTLRGWIGLPPLGTLDTEYTWIVSSSNPSGARVTGIELSFNGISASIQVKLGDDFTGTVIVCAQVTLIRGSLLKEIVYKVPPQIGGVSTAVGWAPNLLYTFNNLPPIYEIRRRGGGWNCGCVDLKVACTCEALDVAWDPESDTTVAPNGSANVAIINHNNCKFTWSISGVGFTIGDSTGATNIVSASDTACGSATITVEGENGEIVTGYVKSTIGVWVLVGSCNGAGCGGSAHTCDVLDGNMFHRGYYYPVGSCDEVCGSLSCYTDNCDGPNGGYCNAWDGTANCGATRTFAWQCA